MHGDGRPGALSSGVSRRDLLRWGGLFTAAAVLGCAPELTTEPDPRATLAGDAPGRTRTRLPARSEPTGPGGQWGDGLDPDADVPGHRPGEPEPEPEPDPEPDPPDTEVVDDDTSGDTDQQEASGDDAETADPDDPGDDVAEDDGADEGGDDEPDTDRSPVTVTVICRDALGLVAAGSGARSHEPRRLTLHHTAVRLGENRNAPGRLRAHQRFHQDNGWADIAYHLGVDARGNVYELRDPGLAGDTFTAYDPAGHFLVVCEGDYDQERPTDAMLDATARILAHGAVRYGIAADTLTGHRDHAGTSCPGSNLYARLPELRDEVGRLVAAGVEHRSLCGSAGRDRVAAIESG